MLRIGFIGTGNFARQHAEVLRELGAQIVACHGTNPDKTAAFAQDFQCKIYDDPLALISPDVIDALYIVIPPFAHDGKIETRAVEQNIPFLCEKPVGLDLTSCENIVRKLEETGLITSSGYMLRHEPLFTQIKEIINRNLISTIRMCSYSYMPEVHWWRKLALSGGMMVESGSHYLDLLRYIFGEITTVSAITTDGIAQNNIPHCDIYDSMEAILKFDSGKIGSIGITHLLNKIHARNDVLEIYGYDFALKVDLYKLRYKNEANAMYKESGDTNWKIISHMSNKKSLLTSQSTSFIAAIQQNNSSLIKSSYPDAVQSLKIALAMNHSANLSKFTMI